MTIKNFEMLFNKVKGNTMPQMLISKYLLNKTSKLKERWKKNTEENNQHFNRNYNKLTTI